MEKSQCPKRPFSFAQRLLQPTEPKALAATFPGISEKPMSTGPNVPVFGRSANPQLFCLPVVKQASGDLGITSVR